MITLIKGGVYDDLSLTVGEALKKRSPVCLPIFIKTSGCPCWLNWYRLQDFPGIYTCSLTDGLDTIFDTIRKSRVHRLVVVDDHFRLKGVLTLSDILHYILLEGETDETAWLWLDLFFFFHLLPRIWHILAWKGVLLFLIGSQSQISFVLSFFLFFLLLFRLKGKREKEKTMATVNPCD